MYLYYIENNDENIHGLLRFCSRLTIVGQLSFNLIKLTLSFNQIIINHSRLVEIGLLMLSALL